jgi:hypothetical protein
LREIASLKQAHQNLQSDSDSRRASLQASCAAITDSLEQFKRKRLAETEELNRRLFELCAQGSREASKLRDLSAQLTEQLRESERRHRESASKQMSDFESARTRCHEEASNLKQQLELAQRAEVEIRRSHATIATDLTFERDTSKRQLQLLQRRFEQLTQSNRQLVESADQRVVSLSMALEVVEKQLNETNATLGKVQAELLDERLKHRTTGFELTQARSEVAATQNTRDDNRRWASEVQTLTADLSRAQIESVDKESLLSELRAQLQRSQLEVESLQSKVRVVGSDSDRTVATLQSQLATLNQQLVDERDANDRGQDQAQTKNIHLEKRADAAWLEVSRLTHEVERLTDSTVNASRANIAVASGAGGSGGRGHERRPRHRATAPSVAFAPGSAGAASALGMPTGSSSAASAPGSAGAAFAPGEFSFAQNPFHHSRRRSGDDPPGGGDPDDDGNDDGDEDYDDDEDLEVGDAPSRDGRTPRRGRQSRRSYSSESGSDSSRQGRKVKEAEKIDVPNFPTIVQLDNWKIRLGYALVAASGRGDSKEIAWLRRCWDPDTRHEDLQASRRRRYATLDFRLGKAILESVRAHGAPVKFSRENILRLQRQAFAANAVVSGRRMVWLIDVRFRTSGSFEMVYSVEHLSKIEYLGDNKLPEFFSSWNKIVESTRDKLAQETLRDVLYRKIRKSAALGNDIHHFERLDHGNPEKSYQFLYEAMQRRVLRRTEEAHWTDRGNLLERKDLDNPAAKRKQRGRSKSRGKDATEKAAPAAKAKGRADKPAAPASSGGAADGRKPCFFHNNGGCDRGKECRFKRIMVPKGEREGLMPRKRSPSPQPKAKAKGRDAASPAPRPRLKPRARGRLEVHLLVLLSRFATRVLLMLDVRRVLIASALASPRLLSSG